VAIADNARMWDPEIRQALRAELARRYAGSDPGTLIIDELPICRHAARADLAVINGHLAGYEIKSDRDTLRRLGRQRDAYGKVFDYATVAAAANHTNELSDFLPEWWGIVEVAVSGGRIGFRELRRASLNSQQCPLSVCQLLWRNEALDILEARGLAHRVRSLPRRRLWEIIAGSVPLDELRHLVATKLKARDHWRVGASRT